MGHAAILHVCMATLICMGGSIPLNYLDYTAVAEGLTLVTTLSFKHSGTRSWPSIVTSDAFTLEYSQGKLLLITIILASYCQNQCSIVLVLGPLVVCGGGKRGNRQTDRPQTKYCNACSTY